MYKKISKKLLSSITALAVMLSMFIVYSDKQFVVDTQAAISVDYAPQLMNIASKDNSSVLTENGTADGSALSVKALGNSLSASWRFQRVGADGNGTFFKIVNAESGRLLTPNGTGVMVYGDESAKNQHWYAVPVQQDRFGNDLYYKIVNYTDTSMALTQGSTLSISSYTGADNQLWLLNADGLQGFAGYCFDDTTGNIKASDIGGLFGETVEVSTFEDLKKYATSDEPYTIVVNNNISVTELNMNGTRYMCSAGRIYVHSNKTIIGSYSAHTLFNVQFCTSTNSGVGDNIIIKNFDMQHDSESNNNDSIVCYFGSGQNIWVDHVTFTGHENYGYASNGEVDEDKFLACCYDADYCTVSDSSFGGHKYGLILGYPADGENEYLNYNNYPRMSLIGNKFDDTSTRAPGLMRWGYYHSLNNYVNKFSMAYTVISNCKIFAENCVYENGGNVICDWNTCDYVGSYSETGSIFTDCNRTVQGGDSNSTATACSWRPKSNYSYVSLTAANAKNYCNSYCGSQSSNGNMMYLRFGSSGVPSAGYVETPDAPIITPATFTEGGVYRIKNVNSGMYLAVNGEAADNANVIQSADDTNASMWRVFAAPKEGYYYMYSLLGDGASYCLNLADNSTENGANIEIFSKNYKDAQQVMFVANEVGTAYTIRPRLADGATGIGVSAASTESGANVISWEINGSSDQEWTLEEVSHPGVAMDTTVNYEFENVNSGMVMDIVSGTMADDTNVQQWSTGNYKSQQWILKEFTGGGNYYYIHSVSNPEYVLKAENGSNGGNIFITTYSNKDSSMLFKFAKNPDGTYHIMTRASKDACLVEVADASTSSGANVQQWEPTYNDCQKWNAVTFTTTTTIVTTTTTTTTTTTVTTEKLVETMSDIPIETTVSDTTVSETVKETTVTTTTPSVTTVTTTSKTIETTTLSETTTKAIETTKTETTTVTNPSETEPSTEIVTPSLLGDVDCSGGIDVADLTMLAKHILNKNIFPLSGNVSNANSDVNNDKQIDSSDTAKLAEFILEKIIAFV